MQETLTQTFKSMVLAYKIMNDVFRTFHVENIFIVRWSVERDVDTRNGNL